MLVFSESLKGGAAQRRKKTQNAVLTGAFIKYLFWTSAQLRSPIFSAYFFMRSERISEFGMHGQIDRGVSCERFAVGVGVFGSPLYLSTIRIEHGPFKVVLSFEGGTGWVGGSGLAWDPSVEHVQATT